MDNLKNVVAARNISSARGWLLAGCLAAALPFAALAQEAPAQKPLTSREGGSAKPNIVLTLDESGSMAFQYLPEGSFKVGSFTVNFPESYTLLMHPDDPRQGNGGSIVGFIPARLDTETVFQKQMRSPDVNKIYYNPEVRYFPWMNVDGTRMADATYTSVRFDPLNIKTSSTADLSLVTSNKSPRSLNGSAEWCTKMTFTQSSPCSDSNKYQFNPGIYYRLKKTNAGAFLDPNDASNYTRYNLNDSGVTSYPWGKNTFPDRTDCGPSSCTRDIEKQNFANWFQYHRSRLHAAQAGVPEAFQGFNDRIRVGWGDIKKGVTNIDGVNTAIVSQGVRDFTTPHKTLLFNWMRSMDVSGGTPLREAMYGVGQYFSRTDNAGPWGDSPGSGVSGPHKTCRRSYNVLITDGYWNTSGAVLTLPNLGNVDNTDGASIPPNGFKYIATRPYRDGNSNTLADVAMYFWNRDLRTDLANKVLPTADNPAYWQHMTNFTVGFGVKGKLDPATDLPALSSGVKTWSTDEIDDLWHAALNSRGQFFSANNAAELATAIRSSVNQAVERELKEAGVAAAATVLEDGNRKYIPKYRTGAWTGDVDAYQLDALGQTGAKLWSASEHLPVWNNRRIFTWDPGQPTPQGVDFTWNTISGSSRTAVGGKGQALVDYIRGDRSNEGATGTTFRIRDAILGDIVNSTPVFAKDAIVEPYGKLPTIGSSYPAFLEKKATRLGVLYVGGNGGMLHGFRDSKGVTPATDGTEVFAYVPRAVYGSLATLTEQNYGQLDNYHKFFVDGPLVEHDAFVRAPGAGTASWRNYLVGSLGAGGRAVFALDVTDPTAADGSIALNGSNIRWEISSADHPELGFITAPIEVGVVPDGTTTGKWIAIFGNGYVDNLTTKATLFVVGLQDGSVTKLEVSSVVGNGLGGVSVKRNSFGQIEAAYAGDLKGNMWKFVWNQANARFEIANNQKPVFTGPVTQPIVQPPIVMPHSEGDWVVFGTGRLLTNGDADSTTLQAIYGLRLKTSDPVGTTWVKNALRTDLAVRTINTLIGVDGSPYFDLTGSTIDWSTSSFHGWSIDMTIAGYTGLRQAYAPQTIAGELAFFSLIAPAQNVLECEQASGRGVNLIFPVETGLSAQQAILDTNGDGVINSADNFGHIAGYATTADGIDAVLRNRTPIKGPCANGICKETTEYSVQNTTGGRKFQYTKDVPEGCTVNCDNPPPPGAISGTPKDRVWRRIVNPPIR